MTKRTLRRLEPQPIEENEIPWQGDDREGYQALLNGYTALLTPRRGSKALWTLTHCPASPEGLDVHPVCCVGAGEADTIRVAKRAAVVHAFRRAPGMDR